jgi:hypothetical protein
MIAEKKNINSRFARGGGFCVYVHRYPEQLAVRCFLHFSFIYFNALRNFSKHVFVISFMDRFTACSDEFNREVPVIYP